MRTIFMVCLIAGCSEPSTSAPADASPAGTSGSGAAGGAGGSGGSSGTGGGGTGAFGSGGTNTGGSGAAGGSGGVAGSAGGGPEPACPPGASYGAPIPSTASVEPVQGGYHFLEGPVWFAERNLLLFSDMDFSRAGPDNVPPSVIHALTLPDAVLPWVTDVSSNGLGVAPDGSLVACTHDTRSVSRFDIDTKARTELAATFEGKRFNSPNDVIVRSDGTLYFTDPTWQLGQRTQEILFKGVYRMRPGGPVELVTGDMSSPNGIALSPDERTSPVPSSVT